LNRLTLGDHKSYTTTWVDNNNFEEKSLVYDFNGNIKRLIRTNSAASEIANYTYTYSGNKLSNIITNGIINGTTYVYDLNGNTTTDGLRNVAIAYNILNLPKLVSKGADNISYIYSAAGEKLAKKMTNNTYQYYAGNMVYNNDKSLNYLLFDEGLVNKVSGGYAYEYQLKDHLGNTRVTFQPNGSTTTTTQVAEYYPFGSSYLPVSPAGTNKYLYNGKEKQDDILGDTALDWYDYGARFYDPMIGRWHCVDQLAEKYDSYSPYCYVGTNPISRIDPDGRDWDTEKDKEKAKQIQEKSKNQIETLGQSNSVLDKRISDAKEKGNKRKVATLENRKENNKHQIDELKKGIDEIQTLGDRHDYTFTPVSSEDHHVNLLKDGEKPLISIEFSSDALALHESRHAYQYITDGKSSGRMVFGQDSKLNYTSESVTIWYETKAYQLQYSFSNSSLPVSTSGFWGIDKDWLKSIPSNPYKIK